MNNLKFKCRAILIVLFVSFFTISCQSNSGSEESVNETIKSVQNLKVYDIENSGTGSDILIEFDAPVDKSNITEYRVFVFNSSTTVTLNQLLTLGNNSFHSIVQVASENYAVNLPSTFTDTSGELIDAEDTYKVVIASIGSDISIATLSEESSEFSLEVTNLVDTIAEDINAGTGGLSLDSEQNLYLSDFGLTFNGGGDKVFKITPNGTVSVFATGLNGAAGSDFDLNGNLYQSNISENSISKITPDGNVEEYYSSVNYLNFPVGIIVDDQLNLFVTNCGNNNVVKIDFGKEVEIIASGSDFNCPNGITQDENGDLYVTNFNNGNIIKVQQDGTISDFITLPGNQVTHPFYSNGFIYAVARGDFRIYRVSIETLEIEIVAGSGEKGDRNGAGSDAQFTRPNDIAVTSDGSIIYVNDTEINAADNGQLGPVLIRRIRVFEKE
jgi:sugar lactone lactonase YvrE